MKIAAIVIVYRPNEEEVTSNILRYIDHVDYILIWKNSPATILLPDTAQHKVHFMGAEENEFIAKPLNVATDWCLENQVDYLLTMDQDSTWEDFAGFKKNVEAIKDDTVAIFAPNINRSFPITATPTEIQSTITSASLHNVSIIKRLGGFREDYQIYWVDGEFCYWARANGFKILLLSQYNLEQQFGRAKKIWRNIHAANYSVSTNYFLYRNMLWMRREFPKGVSWKTVLHTIRLYVPGIILGEKQKGKKLIIIVKAFYEGLFHKITKRKDIQV